MKKVLTCWVFACFFLLSVFAAGGTYMPNTATLPINLAGGAGVVTGVLPTGNQAAQSVSCSGDVSCSGTTASESTTVTAISGSSPVVVTPSNLQFNAVTATPTISQANTSAATGQSMVFCQPQQSTNTPGTGGACVANLQAPLGAGSEVALAVQRNSSNRVQLGPQVGTPANGQVTLGNVTESSTNYTLSSDGSSVTYLNTPGTIYFQVSGAGYGGGSGYVAMSTGSVTEFGGARIQIPWQGSNTGQGQIIEFIPIVAQTTVASAQTLYTYATTTGKTVVLNIDGGWATQSACGNVAEFKNVSGTVTQIGTTQSKYIINTGACSFTISGTNILVQGASGISSTENFQGLLVANLI